MRTWVFLAEGSPKPQYLLGEHPPGYCAWTASADEAISFATPHDAWKWIHTRLSPNEVRMIEIRRTARPDDTGIPAVMGIQRIYGPDGRLIYPEPFISQPKGMRRDD